jgi:cation diffusion facilitator family transporter
VQPGNRKAILAALAANFGLALAKLVGWATTGAASMLAEAVHSVADTGNQILLLWGAASAERPATVDHPFGFARDRYFWAFVVSLVIFALGSLFAIYEGVSKLLHPHEIARPMVAVAILVAGIAMEGFSLRTAVIEASRQKKQLGWWAFIRQTKNPELPVILLEDLGALLGLALALLGIGLASLTGDPRFDALGSITIGGLLAVIAAVLAIEMRSLLIGEAASPEDRDAIRQSLSETPSLERVIHMRTQHFGPDQLLVALKVQFEAGLTTEGIADGINEAERRIRERVPVAKLIFIEPDIYRSGKADVGADPPEPSSSRSRTSPTHSG